MARDIRLHLVRHGQSVANLDKAVNRTVADHALDLSDEGKTQPVKTGEYFGGFFHGKPLAGVRAYVSPYARTRQTWAGIHQGIAATLGKAAADSIPVVESILIRELEFGLFDGIPDEDLAREFPREHAHYQKHLKFEGEFYARMPLGESRADVAQRVHQFFGTLARDADRHGVTDAIIVSHGVTIRAFLMMWLDKTPEWYAGERNPNNCSVRLVENQRDLGYAFAGFEHARAPRKQDAREEGKVG